MLQRLDKTKNNLIDKILQNQHEKAWATKTRLLSDEIKISIDETPPPSSHIIKKITKEATNNNFHLNITATATEKSKTKHLLDGIGIWTPCNRPKYMSNLNRDQASIIFKARVRMLPVKNNYRSQHKHNICWGCKAEPENQQHVLEICREIHKNNDI